MKILRGVCVAFLMAANACQAFSLLGPYEDWMQRTNGFRDMVDIGGSVTLHEEYRWNVPVLTYAFDQTFLDYFGSNGVVAVEQAIQKLNDLPTSTTLNPDSYPLNTTQENFSAQALGLIDLKSHTLHLLLEQMGLAQPTPNVFTLRTWDNGFLTTPCEFDWGAGVVGQLVYERNYDPVSLVPSHYVNGTQLSGCVHASGPSNTANFRASVEEYAIDPLALRQTAVADLALRKGIFHTGLTRDDVGALRYLLSSNNINFEALLPGITGPAGHTNQALRLGVEKVVFVRPDYDAIVGQFVVPLTNQYTDFYLSNGIVIAQQLHRVVHQPDLLFAVKDLGFNFLGFPFVARTGTTNWLNCATNAAANGPGIIRPQIVINFPPVGSTIWTFDDYGDDFFQDVTYRWGSFDLTTNPPVIYPTIPIGDSRVRLQFIKANELRESFVWRVLGAPNSLLLQTSTNLVTWTTVTTTGNEGSIVQWYHSISGERKYFRVQPQ